MRYLRPFAIRGTRHERVFLLDGATGPVLAYFMEVEEPKTARRAYASSELLIYREHRRVMDEVLEGPVEVEELLDLCAP